MKKQFHFLRYLGITALLLVLAFLFSLAVILGHPETGERAVEMVQSLMPASPALSMAEGDELIAMRDLFPAPVLMCPTNELLAVKASSMDTAFEDGFARILRITYTDQNGSEVIVTSIYPRRAVTLISDSDLSLTGKGLEIAGYPSARMEGGNRVRMHIQTEFGIYCVETAIDHLDELSGFLQKLQLVIPSEEHG